MKVTRNLAICLALSICSWASSSELSYTCVVHATYELGDDGLLVPSVWEDQFVDGQFSVSRVTGEIIGEVIPTLKAISTNVILVGGSQYSFKTSAHFENQIQVLEVKEFKSGEEKPFVSMSMGGAGIVTGTCK